MNDIDWVLGLKNRGGHTHEELVIESDGIFPYIGAIPSTGFLMGHDILDREAYVITNEMLETKIPGVFAAGDLRQKHLRQIVTAASDGAVAAQNAFHYIKNLKD